MAEFVEISTRQEMQSGQMKMFHVAGYDVLLARVGDNFYAAENWCPHMGGNLSMGTLENTIVTCPRHHSRFDLADGHVVRWTDWTGVKLGLAKVIKSPRPLKTYPVKLEGDKVLVSVEKIPAAVS